ncbi:hypothetical protein [Actinocorallia longicatena]|uniref:Uncharacterized protein n=1 Tax=Actinocorallia longicatena TaxID=111803 RepID=A0ABP6PXT8_9ACTN
MARPGRWALRGGPAAVRRGRWSVRSVWNPDHTGEMRTLAPAEPIEDDQDGLVSTER